MQIAATVTRQPGGKLHIQWQDGVLAPPVNLHWSRQSGGDNEDWRYLLTTSQGNQLTVDDPSPRARPYFKLETTGTSLVVAERQLPLEGSPNFRDLGGYLTSDGRSVRWGQLYRSSDLSRLTDADLETLEQLDLKLVCDFRTDFEVGQAPNRPLETAALLKLPIPGGEMPMQELYEAVGKGNFSGLDDHHLARANQRFVREFSPVYAEMLQRISRQENRPALLHCTAGKDRTGLGSAILLWALGVPTETIFADYLLTNDYNAQRNETMLGMLRQHIASANGVDPESIDLSPMVALTSARRVYLQSAVDTITGDFGSIENYLRQGLGLNEVSQQQLQDALLI